MCRGGRATQRGGSGEVGGTNGRFPCLPSGSSFGVVLCRMMQRGYGEIQIRWKRPRWLG